MRKLLLICACFSSVPNKPFKISIIVPSTMLQICVLGPHKHYNTCSISIMHFCFTVNHFESSTNSTYAVKPGSYHTTRPKTVRQYHDALRSSYNLRAKEGFQYWLLERPKPTPCKQNQYSTSISVLTQLMLLNKCSKLCRLQKSIGNFNCLQLIWSQYILSSLTFQDRLIIVQLAIIRVEGLPLLINSSQRYSNTYNHGWHLTVISLTVEVAIVKGRDDR